jgi:molybdopterin-containing oxidoreductase family iron-sulfur binding subunit
MYAGTRIAFGAAADPLYRFEKAEVILSLDADFLFGMPGSVRYAREFSKKRKVRDEHGEMNRLYVVESAPSISGSVADHRLALRSGEIELFAREVANRLGVSGVNSGKWDNAAKFTKWIAALVSDLQKHRGSSLVVAGEHQSPAVHALAHAMNQALGSVGQTVVYIESVRANPVSQLDSLREHQRDGSRKSRVAGELGRQSCLYCSS